MNGGGDLRKLLTLRSYLWVTNYDPRSPGPQMPLLV